MVHWVTPRRTRHHGSHQIAVRVVADDDIGPGAELAEDLALGVARELLEIGPDLEAGDPLGKDLVIFVAERNAQYPRRVGSRHRFQSLIAARVLRLGDESRDYENLRFDVHSLLFESVSHFALERAYLVEDVNHLTAGVGRPVRSPGRTSREAK